MLLFNTKCPNCETYYDSTLNECPHCHKSNQFQAERDISTNIVYFHPLAQAGLFLGGFAYAGMIICELIPLLFLGGVENGDLRKALIIFFAYLLMVGGLLSIALVTRSKPFLKSFTKPSAYAYGTLFAGLAILASLIISMIVSLFKVEDINNNQVVANNMVANYPILAFFIVCVFGPFAEEMTYRVGLQSFLRRINKYLAIIATTIVFAFIHFDFDASNMTAELIALPSYLTCGLILTLGYEFFGPACSITAHVLYNLTSFLMILMRN